MHHVEMVGGGDQRHGNVLRSADAAGGWSPPGCALAAAMTLAAVL
jgi:hypothetical protein